MKTIRNKRLLILMYHDLIEDKTDSTSEHDGKGKLTASEFDAHLRAIKDSCRSLSVDEAVREIKYNGGLRENTVAITFDDGYSSAYDIAFPLLKKHGLCATIFLLNDWINGNMSLWWEDLGYMLKELKIGSVKAAELNRICREIGIDMPGYSLEDRGSRMRLLKILSHELMKISDNRRAELLDDLRRALSSDTKNKRPSIKSLTWKQISEMSKVGIMFGAHTCSHMNLSYADIETARDEIARSKSEIEHHLQQEVRGFAYPYGYDVAGYARFAPLLENLGFDYACTSWWGNNSGNSSLFQLLRDVLPPMESQSLLKRELYINLSEEKIDLARPPSNYP